MRKFFTLLLLGFTFVCFGQNNALNLYYDSDANELEPQQIRQLDAIVSNLDVNRIYELYIAGHADTTMTIPYNEVLSRKRAENVKKYFERKGIDPSVFQISCFGETKATSVDLKFDRRVDIEISYHTNLPSTSKTKE